jgi:hypothetical protein
MNEIADIISNSTLIGFSGSRILSSRDTILALKDVVELIPSHAQVNVGDAAGIDRLVKKLIPNARVFQAEPRYSGDKSAFAGRSIRCVRSVLEPGGLWVAFPNKACPNGLKPSTVTSECFSGTGSGTWASLAYAAGLGISCLVFMPVIAPPDWRFIDIGGGWYFLPAAWEQLSLFESPNPDKKRTVPYYEVAKVAEMFGAVDVFWRESTNSYTGFVLEAWFSEYPTVFRRNVEKVIQHFVCVRRTEDGPAAYTMSIPVVVPSGQISLGIASKGSRVKLQP